MSDVAGEPETTAASDMVTVVVDDEKCIGSGTCELAEEATFVIPDDDVVARIVGSGELPRERALSVIDKCPSGAISIVEAD